MPSDGSWVMNEYLLNNTGVKKNEMDFASHEVPFPALSDQRSWAAGTGTSWEVQTTHGVHLLITMI